MSVLDFTDWIYGCKWLRGFRSGNTRGHGGASEPFYLRTLQITERTMGPDHPQVALVLNNLADLYRAQNRCDEAESHYLKALKISEKKLGPEHPQVGLILEGYAHLLLNMKRLREAADIGKRAIRIRIKHAKEELNK
ncbi:MAG TPA: tetratricopeptide repeat protein [Candidatus Binatia bacterium]